MDWRDSASRQAQSDLDSLFNDSIDAAADALGRQGMLAPFMLVIGTGGHRAMRQTPQQPAGATEETIVDSLQHADDGAELRARATVFDVATAAPVRGSALKITLEHREGQAIDLLVPYRLDDTTLDIDVQQANAAAGERRLWRPRGGVPG